MWKIVDYEKSFLQAMVEMAIENYGSENDISNPNFLYHEYFDNPIGNALIFLAYDEENKSLAGQYVVTPQKFKVFDKEVRAIESLNTLTRTSYRGQGVFTGLASRAFETAQHEGFAFCYGAPNPNSYPGFIKKLGFIKVVEMPMYLKPLKPSRFVGEKTNGFLGFLAALFNVFTIQPKIKEPGIIRLDLDNVAFVNVLWEKIKDKYHVIGVRDSRYIEYRYLRVPGRAYLPYVYLVGGEPVAFAVGRIREVAGMTAGMIADFIYVDGFEKQAKKLLQFLCAKMKKSGAGLSGCLMLSHCAEVKVLKKAGFFKCPDRLLPQPTPLILRVFDDSFAEALYDIKNWFFTTGDYDVV